MATPRARPSPPPTRRRRSACPPVGNRPSANNTACNAHPAANSMRASGQAAPLPMERHEPHAIRRGSNWAIGELGGQLLDELAVDGDKKLSGSTHVGSGGVVGRSSLVRRRQSPTATVRLAIGSRSSVPASIAAGATKLTLVGAAAIGGTEHRAGTPAARRDRALASHHRPAIIPPLTTTCGRTAIRRVPQHQVSKLADNHRADLVVEAVRHRWHDRVLGDVALGAALSACRRRRVRRRHFIVGGLPGADHDLADVPIAHCPSRSSRSPRGRGGCPLPRWSTGGCDSRRTPDPRRSTG